jgi:hypothetical protein
MLMVISRKLCQVDFRFALCRVQVIAEFRLQVIAEFRLQVIAEFRLEEESVSRHFLWETIWLRCRNCRKLTEKKKG